MFFKSAFTHKNSVMPVYIFLFVKLCPYMLEMGILEVYRSTLTTMTPFYASKSNKTLLYMKQ